MAITESERLEALKQALASTRIEGHEPTPEFLVDCERHARGELSDAEVMAASLARARAVDAGQP